MNITTGEQTFFLEFHRRLSILQRMLDITDTRWNCYAALIQDRRPISEASLAEYRQTDGKYDLSHFAYDAARDSFTCLEGYEMPFRKIDVTRRIKQYSADAGTCGTCPIRKACTTAPAGTVSRHMDENARQIARDLSRTEQFELSRRKRKKVEMLFAHLKRNLGFTCATGAGESLTAAVCRQAYQVGPASWLGFSGTLGWGPMNFRPGFG